MSKKFPQPEDSDADSFALNRPSDSVSRFSQGKQPRPEQANSPEFPTASTDEEVKFKQMGWKGIDDDDEDFEPEFNIKKEPIPEDELDMTPMVDVTFLLLIFFMVTASFTLQKSIKQPPAQSECAKHQRRRY